MNLLTLTIYFKKLSSFGLKKIFIDKAPFNFMIGLIKKIIPNSK